MNEFPLISIIIPVYKVEKYLEHCIQSVVNQSYKNLEIILVDDGSPDRCPEICDAWAKKDDRIRVVHKKNGGLSDARNAGLAIARGEYIGFVDSDDYIEKEMYATLLDNMLATRADIAICNTAYINEETGECMNIESPMKNETLSREEALEKLVEKNWWYYVTAWNKLYTRESLKNIAFPKGKIHEDQFVVHRIFYNCNKIVCVDSKLYNYVQRPNSIMSNTAAIAHLDDVEALCDRIMFFKSYGMKKLSERTCPVLKIEYNRYRGKLYVHNLGTSEKERVKKIDQMFKTIYFETVPSVTTKDQLRYAIPDLILPIEKIYHQLHIKRRILFMREIIKYSCKRKDVVIIDTPTHENLGDHAIVLAEEQVVHKVTPSARIAELTATQIDHREKRYAALTPMNQYILVHGGGFLGALWPNEEYRFRRILQAFSKNKIIVFPQTVTFDLTTSNGREFLAESQRIYSAHPDLTIFVREKRSYAFMQQYFPTVKCLLVPDIVTLLDVPNMASPRKGILFCMRRDREKALDNAAQQEMLTAVKTQYSDEDIEFTDTVIDHNVMPENREEEVNKKLAQFSGARLIVTDRLHGMIFAALTNTPCIAMSNSNGKVKAVYEWIKGNDYVRFANSVEEFIQQLQTLDVSCQYTYDRKLTEREFRPLFEEIRKLQK